MIYQARKRACYQTLVLTRMQPVMQLEAEWFLFPCRQPSSLVLKRVVTVSQRKLRKQNSTESPFLPRV